MQQKLGRKATEGSGGDEQGALKATGMPAVQLDFDKHQAEGRPQAFDLTECKMGHRRPEKPLFESVASQALRQSEHPIFDLVTGVAQTEAAHALSIKKISLALRMAKLYERGGLLLAAPDRVVPSDIDLLVSAVPYVRPQHPALRFFRNAAEIGIKTLRKAGLLYDPDEDGWNSPSDSVRRQLMELTDQVFQKIFDRTRVFMSIRFVSPKVSTKVPAIPEILERIQSLHFDIDASPPSYKVLAGVTFYRQGKS